MEKSLILLSFLTSLFINWIGLLENVGARDRRETLVQGRCALGDRGVDRECLSKQDPELEESDRNHRILEQIGLEEP